MSRQYFEDCPIEPLSGTNTIVSSTGAAITATAETALFPAAQISIPAADVRPGKMWRLTAGGIYTTNTTGTLIITPRWGTTTSGITMGASVTQAPVFSLTNEAWFMHAIMVCLTTSWQSGVHATFICNGIFNGGGAAATASSGLQLCFGGTSATGDPTLGGFFIGWTLSVAGAVSPQTCVLTSIN